MFSVLAGNKKDEYLLSGSYWDMGRYVQIRLVLRNYKGEGRTINTRVHKASILPGLELTFDNRGDGDNHGYGPKDWINILRVQSGFQGW